MSYRWTSSTGTPGHKMPNEEKIKILSKESKVSFPSIEETDKSPSIDENLDVLNSQPSFKSRPSKEGEKTMTESKNLLSNEVSSLLVDKNNDTKLSAASSFEISEDIDKQWTVSLVDSGLPSSGRSSRGIDDLESPSIAHNEEGDALLSGINEDDHESSSMNKSKKSCIDNEDQRTKPSVAASSSKRGSVKSNIADDLYSIPPVEVIESLDKVIESLERIIEPLEAGTKSTSSEYDMVRVQFHNL